MYGEQNSRNLISLTSSVVLIKQYRNTVRCNTFQQNSAHDNKQWLNWVELHAIESEEYNSNNLIPNEPRVSKFHSLQSFDPFPVKSAQLKEV